MTVRRTISRCLVKLRAKYRALWANGALVLLLALLVLLPIWTTPTMHMRSAVQDTLFVVDISESMNVRDVDYPRPHTARLQLAKQVVTASMASLPCGSRVSVALFAGDESVVLFEPLEICRHFPAIERVVTGLDSRMRWVGDSWVVRALLMSIKEAQKRQLNVVMITDGDEMPHKNAPRLVELSEIKGKTKGMMIGVGQATPSPVPRLNDRQEIIGYWTPEEAVLEGNHPNLLAYVKSLAPGERASPESLAEVGEHLSAYNQSLLQSVAGAATFEFAHVSHPQQAVRLLQQQKFQQMSLAEHDARWLFGLMSAVLFLLAWYWHPLRRVIHIRP